MNPRRLSVAHLTAIHATPPELIRAASQAGFDGVGLRLLQVTETTPGYPLMDDRAMMRETLSALGETGARVYDIEFVRLMPETDVARFHPLLEAGAELGAGHLIAAPYDDDLERLADNLAALTEMASTYAIGVVLEFFPWTSVPDLATAWNVVRRAGAATGILVDSLHLDRSGSKPGDLAVIPAERLPFAHLCDAPVDPPYSLEQLLFAARDERLAPGDGAIALDRFVTALPPRTPLGLEIPSRQTVRGVELAARLGTLRKAALTLLDAIGTQDGGNVRS